jgi:Ca-activated chloride channel homolog
MKQILHCIVLFTVLPLSANAESVRDIVQRGLDAYHAENYTAALDAYEEALVSAPESAEIPFNQGAVHYRLENYEEAKKAFEDAAVRTKDLALEARAQYNLGNCAFREGERQRDSDLKKALEHFEASVRHYQRALELDPELPGAAENIEVTRLTIKILLDEIKKQQEEQQKQQEAREALEQLIERQEALRDQSTQSPPAAQCAGLSQEQGLVRDETSALAQQMLAPPADPNTPSPMAGAGQLLEQAVPPQTTAEGLLQAAQPENALPAQEEALEHMKAALDSMKQEEQEDGEKQEQQDQQQQEQEQGEEEKEGQEEQSGEGEGDEEKEEQEQEQEQEQEGQEGESEESEAPQPGTVLNETPEDILEEEENREDMRRMPGGQGRVDKDW